MPNGHLSEELLDDIVDFLHGSRDALKSCSLVSKSWVPRARKHLFAEIKFSTTESLRSWGSTFSDPSTSPACYSRILLVGRPPLESVAANGEEWRWIQTFTRIQVLDLDTNVINPSQLPITLLQFYGFSPGLKTLRLAFRAFPSSQVFGLILSFPLLDDLRVVVSCTWIESRPRNTVSGDQAIALQSLVSPPFTGFLELDLKTGLDFLASWLLSLPGGLHFRSLHLTLNRQSNAVPATALVEGCSSTLEFLEVDCKISSLFIHYLRPQQ